MIIKYFSWIREHVGKSEEEIELPHNIKTIDDLIKYLASLNDNYKSAFANKEIIKIDTNYYRPTEVESLLGDSSKAKKELGWEPKISFEELVKEMVEKDLKSIS